MTELPLHQHDQAAHLEPTRDDLQGYSLGEINRSAESLHAMFYPLDRKGPLRTIEDIFEREGQVAILDAGAGTGKQLYDLVGQATSQFSIDRGSIVADAVSDHDFLPYAAPEVQEAYEAGDLNYHQADLKDDSLPENAYDLVYAHETLVHNDNPDAIVRNLWDSLRANGVLYFNADGEQEPEIARALDEIAKQGGKIVPGKLEYPPLLTGAARRRGYEISPRLIYRVTKPAA